MPTQGAGERPAQGEGVETFRALKNRTGSNRLPERKVSRTSKMGTFPAGIGTPDARKRACPVRGALDGNLLSKGSKALSFDPGDFITKKRREAPAFMPGMDRRWARRAQCPRAQQDPRSA